MAVRFFALAVGAALALGGCMRGFTSLSVNGPSTTVPAAPATEPIVRGATTEPVVRTSATVTTTFVSGGGN